jgi:hypothetical protein
LKKTSVLRKWYKCNVRQAADQYENSILLQITMKQIAALLIGLFIYMVNATYYGPYVCDTEACRRLPDISSGRKCMCLSEVSTYSINCDSSLNCGTVRVFASTDCTGAYDTIVGSTPFEPAYWVNSMSFGSTASSSMYGTCATFDGYLG